jgi:hypothetical protein
MEVAKLGRVVLLADSNSDRNDRCTDPLFELGALRSMVSSGLAS